MMPLPNASLEEASPSLLLSILVRMDELVELNVDMEDFIQIPSLPTYDPRDVT